MTAHFNELHFAWTFFQFTMSEVLVWEWVQGLLRSTFSKSNVKNIN
jgi:hypothetical protein